MVEDVYHYLKSRLPEALGLNGFEGTTFGFPILYAVKGVRTPDPLSVEEALEKLRSMEGGYHLDALWLAEVAESGATDAGLYFMGDDRFRRSCVGLNEGTNGWALILGGGKGALNRLVEGLTARRFRPFASGAAARILGGDERVTNLGERETGIVYFGQMLTRYVLIYGMIEAGDAHEISHSIEEYAPGAIFIVGDLTDVERTLVQGMLALGAPVVVLNDDRGLAGHINVVTDVPAMIETAWKLPNIRARTVEKVSPDVPVPVGRPLLKEQIKEEDVEVKLEGSASSFLVAKNSPGVLEDGVQLIGSMGDAAGFSVLIELGNEAADPPITLWVEAILRRVINYAKGVKVRTEGGRTVQFLMTREARTAGFELEHLGHMIITELRNEFHAIGPVRVTFILDEGEEERLRPEIDAFKEERPRQIKDASEDDIDSFYGCTRCRSFALAHACTVTPDRPAQCSKPWYQLKAYAVLAPDDIFNACQLVEKGDCLDPVRGEYLGVNESTEERSEGRVKRVFLHSVFGYPHTACSCFQNVVYHIPEVDGLAIMNRGYEGEAPGGWTWTKLANLVAGKQYRQGAATIATAYLMSDKFLQADGGYYRVVWMTEALKKVALNSIPEELRGSITTEKDATTLQDLKTFLAEKGRKIIGH